MPNHFDLTVTAPSVVAVDFLAEKTGLSKAKLKDAMNKGACWWVLKGKQQRLRRATKELFKGSRIQLYYDEHVLARPTLDAVCLKDFGDYSAWIKPHGMLAQGSQWGDHCSLLRAVEIKRNAIPYLIHRLDADATGLMLVAHTGQAAAKLSHLFQSRELYKEYRAWVEGHLVIDGERIIDTPIEDKEARSRVTTLRYDAETNQTWVQVVIETGRKHQIRRHLAGIGFPIVSDRLYGSAGKVPLQLIAYRLAFDSPFSNQRIDIQLPDQYDSSLHA